jgi:hypothetical protein
MCAPTLCLKKSVEMYMAKFTFKSYIILHLNTLKYRLSEFVWYNKFAQKVNTKPEINMVAEVPNLYKISSYLSSVGALSSRV